MMNDKHPCIIRAAEIDNALAKEYRQYLTGKLSREQKHLKHIEDDIEIGVSYYESFAADTPHVHPVATEHGYVLQGSIKMRCTDSAEEYEFSAGDFFVVPVGVPYASKNAPGTKVLFIKSPGINDKTPVDVDQETENWLLQWD